MDWQEYKWYCDQPQYFSRWALKTSAAALGRTPLSRQLLHMPEATRLPKPPDHKGGEETDYFEVSIAAEDALQIVRALNTQLEQMEGKAFRRTRHLRDVWQEYLDWLHGS